MGVATGRCRRFHGLGAVRMCDISQKRRLGCKQTCQIESYLGLHFASSGKAAVAPERGTSNRPAQFARLRMIKPATRSIVSDYPDKTRHASSRFQAQYFMFSFWPRRILSFRRANRQSGPGPWAGSSVHLEEVVLLLGCPLLVEGQSCPLTNLRQVLRPDSLTLSVRCLRCLRHFSGGCLSHAALLRSCKALVGCQQARCLRSDRLITTLVDQ